MLHLQRLATVSSTAAAVATTAASSLKMIVPQELKLACSDGIQLAGQLWKSELVAKNSAVQPKRILCLHGWLDNCRSFHHLAPALIEANNNSQQDSAVELVALDFVGHGLSSHKSIDGPTVVLTELVYCVAEALEQLGWSSEQVTLIGHSMGAAISCLYAASFPEQVNQMILLEGIGPMERNSNELAQQVRAHVTKRLQSQQDKSKKRLYPNLETAVQARVQTARNYPGSHQYISREAAQQLVERAIAQEQNGGPGLYFLHDARLYWPSIMYLNPEQVNGVLSHISCPTAIFLAQDGWPFDSQRMDQCLNLLRPQQVERLEGSHHFHADPDTAPLVAQKVAQFLEWTSSSHKDS